MVLKTSFNTITPSIQKDYCEYISEAKREAIKQTRLDKIIPMILKGVGLHDKYKNCKCLITLTLQLRSVQTSFSLTLS